VTRKDLQTEIDASYLYDILAKHEEDENIAFVFRQMSDIEKGHARAFADNMHIQLDKNFNPSWRARVIHLIGRIFGYGYILGALMDTEKSISNALVANKKNQNRELSRSDTSHVSILRSVLESGERITGAQLSRFERRHRTVGGNAIRAAVLGGNDGLISNFSLVMGVAGAATDQQAVLLAGMAGLLAGALSMALGEWISVKSSQELYENQMKLEQEELETSPEAEQKEMELIYIAKGIPQAQATEMAAALMRDTSQAHAFLVKEELGINAEELRGSAMEAAISSFILFAIGAIIPVSPFLFSSGLQAIVISVIASAVGLFIIGAAITLFTSRNVWLSGFRQVLFGLAAAAITYGIGRLMGISIAG